MYFESVKVVKDVYTRKGELNKFRVDESAYDAEDVEMLYDDEEKELVILAASEKQLPHYFLLNKVGFYDNVRTEIELTFIDEETFLISPRSGVIFVSKENNEGDKDEVASLDVDGSLSNKQIYENQIKWINQSYILSLVKCGSMGDGWGVLSDRYPYDYIFNFEITASVNGKNIKCLQTKDISLGKISQKAKNMEMERLRKQIAEQRRLESIQREMEEIERAKAKAIGELNNEEYDEEYLMIGYEEED